MEFLELEASVCVDLSRCHPELSEGIVHDPGYLLNKIFRIDKMTEDKWLYL